MCAKMAPGPGPTSADRKGSRLVRSEAASPSAVSSTSAGRCCRTPAESHTEPASAQTDSGTSASKSLFWCSCIARHKDSSVGAGRSPRARCRSPAGEVGAPHWHLRRFDANRKSTPRWQQWCRKIAAPSDLCVAWLQAIQQSALFSHAVAANCKTSAKRSGNRRFPTATWQQCPVRNPLGGARPGQRASNPKLPPTASTNWIPYACSAAPR